MSQHLSFRKLVPAVACACAFSASAADLFFAGDSTLHSRKNIAITASASERALGSWGDALEGFTVPGVKIHNFAHSGCSTKSFIDQGRWTKLLAQVKPGDFVYIQFGHNDQKKYDPKRYVSAEGGYSENLARFAADVRAKGGKPVFGTPMVRRFFAKDGRVSDQLGDYPDAVRTLGKKLGVPVVDMNAFSRRMVESAPRETSLAWFRGAVDGKDMTHPSLAGAKVFADAFVAEVKSNRLEIATLFRDPGAVISIAECGKTPSYAIVLPPDPEPSRQYAAEELRDYIRQITGVALPVATNATPARAVYLDRADKELGDDAFRLKTQGGDLHVVGGKRGILFGVYDILERYGGVGWFASWRTVVPKAASFAVPSMLDETHRPAFRFRGTDWHDVRHTPEFRVRMRMNGFGNGDPRLGGDGFRFVRGLGIAHTFGRLVPQKKYFKDHPEYYSEVNGVRRDGQTQLCLTNPDVLEIVVSNVLAAIKNDPAANVVGISQDDWANYCTCPNCKAIDDEEESHAGTLVRFLNKVAERVCAVHPDMFIETLAYQYTRKPPKKTLLHPRVVPCLCSIECDFSRSLGSKLKKANEAFRKDIEGWAKLTDNLYLWDYTTDYRHYLHPFGNVPVLQDNIRFFRDNGVNFLFEEGGGYHADFAEFKAWLLLKWLWNPELPFQPLADRFMEGYFGKAAPFAKEYLDRYLERCKTDTTRHLGCFAFDAPEVFPDEFVEWALDNWTKAEAAVQDDPDGLYAVRMAEAVPLVTMLDRWTAKAPRVFVTRHPENVRFPDKARSAYEKLMGIMDEAKSRNHKMRLGNLVVRHDLPLRNWKLLVAAQRPSAPCDRGVVTSREFDCWNEQRAKEASDPDATGGKAMRVVNHINASSVYFNLSNLAYDQDAEYRIRIRVKVERVDGGKGEAFWAHLGKKNIVVVKVEDIPDDQYRWYDLGTAKLSPDMVFEFSNGRFANGGGRTAVKATWIDCLEFTRTERAR